MNNKPLVHRLYIINNDMIYTYSHNGRKNKFNYHLQKITPTNCQLVLEYHFQNENQEKDFYRHSIAHTTTVEQLLLWEPNIRPNKMFSLTPNNKSTLSKFINNIIRLEGV